MSDRRPVSYYAARMARHYPDAEGLRRVHEYGLQLARANKGAKPALRQRFLSDEQADYNAAVEEREPWVP
jgi:hypothetical protein